MFTTMKTYMRTFLCLLLFTISAFAGQMTKASPYKNYGSAIVSGSVRMFNVPVPKAYVFITDINQRVLYKTGISVQRKSQVGVKSRHFKFAGLPENTDLSIIVIPYGSQNIMGVAQVRTKANKESFITINMEPFKNLAGRFGDDLFTQLINWTIDNMESSYQKRFENRLHTLLKSNGIKLNTSTKKELSGSFTKTERGGGYYDLDFSKKKLTITTETYTDIHPFQHFSHKNDDIYITTKGCRNTSKVVISGKLIQHKEYKELSGLIYTYRKGQAKPWRAPIYFIQSNRK